MNAIAPISAGEAAWTPPAGPVPIDFVPQTGEQLLWAITSWEWRIFSGQLYKIMVKGDDLGDSGPTETHVLPFIPNVNQREFIANAHWRNIILKARQLGFTTLISILWLDHALFNANQRLGIIAHTLPDAEAILRDKIRFAYDNLPDAIRAIFPLRKASSEEMLFAHNNSSIKVSTSMRSGTIHRLHVSEFGKIAAQFPAKAIEIVTGSLPAVPMNGMAVIESTAEGQEGAFYEMATRAEKLAQIGRMPTKQEWMFHFFPWFADPGYEIDPSLVTFAPSDHAYFDKIEREAGTKLTMRKRAWYVAKRENDFAGDPEKMWREMPSTPDECWRASMEGKWYTREMARARIEGRITSVPHVSSVLVHTFWDIGAGDGTGIWAMQQIGAQHRFLRYFEDWSKGYAHFVKLLRDTGWLFGVHHLPHDAMQQRQQAATVGSPLDALMELAPDWTFTVVPRVETIQHGIEMTRAKFSQAWFDAEGCKEGLHHLETYGKKWNARLGAWSDVPEKLDGHSEAADSFRQWAQGFSPEIISGPKRPTRRRAGGMVV